MKMCKESRKQITLTTSRECSLSLSLSLTHTHTHTRRRSLVRPIARPVICRSATRGQAASRWNSHSDDEDQSKRNEGTSSPRSLTRESANLEVSFSCDLARREVTGTTLDIGSYTVRRSPGDEVKSELRTACARDCRAEPSDTVEDRLGVEVRSSTSMTNDSDHACYYNLLYTMTYLNVRYPLGAISRVHLHRRGDATSPPRPCQRTSAHAEHKLLFCSVRVARCVIITLIIIISILWLRSNIAIQWLLRTDRDQEWQTAASTPGRPWR